MEGQGREPRSQPSKDRRVAQRIEGDLEKPPTANVRSALEQVALAPAKSGREAMAKVTAARTLERLTRGRRQLPPCPPGWHPGPPEFEELDRWYLERHPQVRERMWARFHADRRR